MDKTMSPETPPVLGIANCRDMYERVKRLGDRMEGAWDEDSASTFVMHAWHLCNDWIKRDKKHRPRLATQKCDAKKIPVEMVLVLNVLRDLTNGTKHCVLDPSSEENRVVTKSHNGEIRGYYAWFFRERIPGVTTRGGYYFSVRKLRDITLNYLDWVFDDSIAVKAFPGELHGIIWHCYPGNRIAGITPPEGAILPGGDTKFVA